MPNIHGHASDAHIRVGEYVSEVTTPIPTANIHGHASDAHIKVGEFVSDVASSRPCWSKYGHSSDSTLKVGCVMPDATINPTPLPGSAFGHASELHANSRVCCIRLLPLNPLRYPAVSMDILHSPPWVAGVWLVGLKPLDPALFTVVPTAIRQTSALGMGCVVGRVVPGSLYRDRPPTKSDRTSDVEKPADTDIQGENAAKKTLTGGATASSAAFKNLQNLKITLRTN